MNSRTLRIAAAVLLLLGIFGAELVYWLGTRSADGANPLPVVGEDKVVTRQAQTMMGNETVVIGEWGRALKRPGTQACIILFAGALASGACFYFAGLVDKAGETKSRPGS
ncbi:MAG TPA: hypothetical protein VGO59_18545 [Verrucomicrobiae bacterium]|jgi:hypothetical protein